MLSKINLIECQIVPKNKVKQSSLTNLIIMYTTVPISLHKNISTNLLLLQQFLYSSIIEIGGGI